MDLIFLLKQVCQQFHLFPYFRKKHAKKGNGHDNHKSVEISKKLLGVD